jgi:enterobactin synthetase component D
MVIENTAVQRDRRPELDHLWRLVSNPNVLAGPAVSASLTLGPQLSSSPTELFPDIPLPGDLQHAVLSRQIHYLAGRYCAWRALVALGAAIAPGDLKRTPMGSPAWPDDIVGSITHTGDFVSAAVGWKHEVSGIGIDAERVMAADSARRVRAIVASADEMAALRDCTDGNDCLAVTLVFSIKESLFKCLSPLVGRRFGYGDARVTELDTTARRGRIRLAVPLEPFPRGAEWEGGLEIGATLVHTGLLLLARSDEPHVFGGGPTSQTS